MFEHIEAELAQRARNWLANKRESGFRVSPAKAVGKAFKEKGREDLKTFLEKFTGSGEVFTFDNNFHDLSNYDFLNLSRAWSLIFTGVLIPQIDSTPGEGWSLETFIGEYNEAIRHIPIPQLTKEDILRDRKEDEVAACEDDTQTALITHMLSEGGPKSSSQTPIGFIFSDINNLYRLTPIAYILEKYQNAFDKEVIQSGRFFEKIMLVTRGILPSPVEAAPLQLLTP